MLLARILAVISPLFLGGLFFTLFFKEKSFYLILLLSGGLTFLSIFWLLHKSGQIKKISAYIFYLLMSLFLTAGFLFFFMFLEDQLIKVATFILAVFTLFYYYQQLFSYFIKKPLVNAGDWPLNLNFPETVIIFFWSMVFFGLRDFLSFSAWLLCLVVLILVFSVNGLVQTVIYQKSQPILFNLALAVIMAEFFWAFLSLSLVYYLKGLLLTFIYLGLQMTREIYSRKIENKHLLRNYLLVILALVLAILFSARWF